MAAPQDNIPLGRPIADRDLGAELKRARDRADATGRLLFPHLFGGGDAASPEPAASDRIGGGPDLDAVKRMRIEECGTSPLEMAAEELVHYRACLIEAMKLTDCTEHRDLHLRLANFVKDQDDFRALLMERCS